MPEDDLGPLPAGRHGFSREQVAHHQRERLIAGLAEAVAEHGYNAVTIAHVVRAAKVSRRVFYANFASKEDCFLAAFDVVVDHVRELTAEAVEPIPDWPQRAIAAARALLAFLASEPDLARLCLLESRGAGPAVAARFHEAVAELVPLLEQGRAERPGDRPPLPVSTEDSTIGALVSLAAGKVAAGEAERLPELLPDFTEFILSPYLGPQEAERLARAVA
ncbi:MAG TPA: TetR/AcrR family transcriptional regulator [Solirubrobacterales bacterium]|nr:TetR/AcrR family transcriptional regulator [Solirubrobacterales bacterium]